MLHFILLGPAILALVTEGAAAPQHSLWMQGGVPRPVGAQCWGPGVWPHPIHCRLFSVCRLGLDGSIVGHLFSCPPDSSYSPKIQRCITNQPETPHCATSLEDESLLDNLSAEQLSSNFIPQLSCDMAEAPYCANSETLVLCAPNKALLGVVNCSAQHWAQKTEPLQCDESRSTCATTPIQHAASSREDELHQYNATHNKDFQTSNEDSSQESGDLSLVTVPSHSSSERETTPSKTLLLLPVVSENTDLASDPHHNKTLGAPNHANTTDPTNIYLKISIPNTSSEGDYDNEIYDGDYDYEVYDLKGSLPTYPDIKCTHEGMQCADNTTIMHCSENSVEPLFTLSCSALLHSDDGENAVGYCDHETLSCILSSESMTLSLNVMTLTMKSNKDAKICETSIGLRCIDNVMLVACSGKANGTNYAITCDGAATSETDSFLQGRCYDNSCMIDVIHKNINSDLHAEQSENHEIYHLPPDTRSTESLPSNASVLTNTTDTQENPDVFIQQVEVFNLDEEYEVLKHNLFKNEDYFADDHHEIQLHTVNSSVGGTTDLKTELIENITQNTQDHPSQAEDDPTKIENILPNTRDHNIDLELLPPYTEHSLTDYDAEVTNPAGTEIYPETVSSGGNTELKIEPAENIIQTTQDHPSQANDDPTPVEDTLPSTKEPSIDLELLPPYTDNSPTSYDAEVTNPALTEIYPETISSGGNADFKTGLAENITQRTQDHPSQAEDGPTKVGNTLPSTKESNIDFELLPPYTENSPTDYEAQATNLAETEVYPETHSAGGNTDLKTRLTEHITQIIPQDHSSQAEDDPTSVENTLLSTREPNIGLELLPPYTENSPTDYDAKATNPAGTYIYPQTISTGGNTDFKTGLAENITQRTQDHPAQAEDGSTKVENTLPSTKESNIDFEIYSETVSSLNVDNISVPVSAPETNVNIDSKSTISDNQNQILLSISEITHAETITSIPKSIPIQTASPITDITSTETMIPVPETTPIETTIPISKSRQTVSHVPESTHVETTTSDFILKETTSLIPETTPTEAVPPVSKSIFQNTAPPVPKTILSGTTTPVSKFISRKTTSLVSETLSTEPTTSVSKSIPRETAIPIPETMSTGATTISVSKTTLLVSETSLTEVTTPVSKPIPTQEADGGSVTKLHFNVQLPSTDQTTKLTAEAKKPVFSDEVWGLTSPRTIQSTKETDQYRTSTDLLASESNQDVNEPWEAPETHQDLGNLQKYVCRKAGIQCMDNLTLAACLPDLTVSYTVACRTLIPHVTSEHYLVYCSQQLDTCALNALD